MNEKELTKIVAVEIYRQMCATVGVNALMSWGFSHPRAVVDEDLHGLAFRVCGRLYTGVVAVLLNPNDTYHIKIASAIDGKIRTLREECYCDEFADIIDRYVEVGDDWEAYQEFCKGEYDALKSMGIDANTKVYIV